MKIDARFLTGLAAAAFTFLILLALAGPGPWSGHRAYAGERYYHCERAAGNWHSHAGVSEQAETFRNDNP